MIELDCLVCLVKHEVVTTTERGSVRGVVYNVTLPVLRCPRASDGYEYPAGVADARARMLREALDAAGDGATSVDVWIEVGPDGLVSG